jgi:3-hydroxybutyrate dehydrogenase
MRMGSLAGRVAVITGASRGIGAAIARRLAADGMKVALVARTREAIDELSRELGGVAIVADVTARGASEAIVAEVKRTLGDIDVLVPNAGVEASHKLEGTTDEVWDELLAINATAVFRLCRAAIPTMVTRDYGRVVVVASTAALQGYAYTAAYCASKHAVVGLVRAVAAEIARTPVTINAVCPGFVDTSMVERAATRIHRTTGRDVEAARQALAKMSPQRRLLGVDEVAHVVASLLPDEARGIHGQAIALDGGATAIGGQ